MGVVLHDTVDGASESIEGEVAAPTRTVTVLNINLAKQQQYQSLEQAEPDFRIPSVPFLSFAM